LIELTKKGGGNVRLIDEKLAWSKQSRIDSKNASYKPGGIKKTLLPKFNFLSLFFTLCLFISRRQSTNPQ
jgi:hypothetical protein